MKETQLYGGACKTILRAAHDLGIEAKTLAEVREITGRTPGRAKESLAPEKKKIAQARIDELVGLFMAAHGLFSLGAFRPISAAQQARQYRAKLRSILDEHKQRRASLNRVPRARAKAA
ncbi:MAG TPA: hypothetical protein VMV27_14230 [Candidatus Binataceae bacterium]|nr:hypothetical protein [Candidatus Binataceae bacterium]